MPVPCALQRSGEASTSPIPQPPCPGTITAQSYRIALLASVCLHDGAWCITKKAHLLQLSPPAIMFVRMPSL